MKNENWTVSITRASGGVRERIDCRYAEFDGSERHISCYEYDTFLSLHNGVWLVGVCTLIVAGIILAPMLFRRNNIDPIHINPGAGMFMLAAWPFAMVGASALDGFLR